MVLYITNNDNIGNNNIGNNNIGNNNIGTYTLMIRDKSLSIMLLNYNIALVTGIN